ncbi:uncharacterized protein EV422DRAFT_165734 [Fimicolochytrium jonesii]|uniref:uncharacterized protein n=1 Tax=Fimicolochytrium jonesii TaxID=1396493 RepID=UPI0022FE31F8|nr:uncharacterized protein EV422DRAFT_165734 [Fimicolochytrium jonesii]KAI8818806.1 hypothetical protein EV422DRAFT_165734 [Fimicolochytrium jonesii]
MKGIKLTPYLERKLWAKGYWSSTPHQQWAITGVNGFDQWVVTNYPDVRNDRARAHDALARDLRLLAEHISAEAALKAVKRVQNKLKTVGKDPVNRLWWNRYASDIAQMVVGMDATNYIQSTSRVQGALQQEPEGSGGNDGVEMGETSDDDLVNPRAPDEANEEDELVGDPQWDRVQRGVAVPFDAHDFDIQTREREGRICTAPPGSNVPSDAGCSAYKRRLDGELQA